MDIAIKIRGIYTTALTKIFKEKQFNIISPTDKIIERFNLKDEQQKLYWDFVNITDKKDKQGIIIEGERTKVEKVIEILKNELFDIIIRTPSRPNQKYNNKVGSFSIKDSIDSIVKEVELPYFSKFKLDSIRDSIVPTVKYHHKYKVVMSDSVDKIEQDFKNYPNKRILQEKLNRVLYKNYHYAYELKIYHIKLDGNRISLSAGKIINFNIRDKALVLKRELKEGGVYDGLNLPIEKGDYCITELKEGDYVIVHSYYSKDKVLKGRYYNINTGCEFYPDYIRYVDLEIDVIKYPDGKKKIIDSKLLDKRMEEGFVKEELVRKAKEIAQKI